MKIIALIHTERDLFGITFPDLPGCVSVGDSYRDVLDMGAEALAFHLESMVEDDDVIPAFRTLGDLEANPEFKEDFASAELAVDYSVVFSGKRVEISYNFDENPLKRLKAAAE